MAGSEPAPDVRAFVAARSDAELLESGKVLCRITGHEVLATLDLLEAHWGGKTYRKKARQPVAMAAARES